MGRQGAVQQITQLVIALLGVAAILWMEAPPWQREMVTRAVRARLHVLAARAARSSGHHAMGAELAGRQDDAEHGYRFTYWLSSRVRDKL